MTCPRCGQPDAQGAACPRCGVVFAKLAAARPRPPRPAAPGPDTARPQAEGLSIPNTVAGVVVLGLAVWWGLGQLRDRRPAGDVRPAAATDAAPTAAAQPPAPALPAASAAAPPPVLQEPSAEPLPETGGVAAEDVRRANELILKRGRRQRLDENDLRLAEELNARYPSDPRIGDVLVGVLLALGAQEQEQRRFAEAQARYRRAIAARPENPASHQHLMVLLLDISDFAGAEAAARAALALEPASAELQYSLAYALFRQDKNREAIEAAQASLAVAENAAARSLLERLEKGQRDESGLAERRLAHFHVRYDGGEHEDVGREILRQLEHHFATLVRAFDHEPATAIPVILFSREQYFTASGAPAWSGGVFDGLDGRIRIPIGGLTASLTPEMDSTLVHELTHAFVYDVSRGLATREIQEGVAQYMEGKRIASRFTPEQLAGIADGRAGGVGGFYAEALAFVEYLVSLRGRGGINDLLRAMGETGDVNAAFQRVHGRDYAATQRAWRERLKQLYGS